MTQAEKKIKQTSQLAPQLTVTSRWQGEPGSDTRRKGAGPPRHPPRNEAEPQPGTWPVDTQQGSLPRQSSHVGRQLRLTAQETSVWNHVCVLAGPGWKQVVTHKQRRDPRTRTRTALS